MIENFLNLWNETDILVQEVHRVPNKINPERPTLRHIVIKMVKVKSKETRMKAARMKQVTYEGLS